MRSSLPFMRPNFKHVPCLAIMAAMVCLTPAQANTPAQAAPTSALASQNLSNPTVTAAPQETVSNLSQNTSRNLSCETLLETAGYQQAALQSVVERHAAAQAAGQETSELEKMVYESQARLDRTQGQINTACAA